MRARPLICSAAYALLLLCLGLPAWAATPAPRKTTNAVVPIPALPPHPRLLFTKAALGDIRARAEQTDWGKAEFQRIRRNADHWLTNVIDLPDRGAQWPHHYACKKDGGRLKTESPTRHVCQICGEVYSGWPYDDVVLGSRHSRLIDAVRDCGFMFQYTGDRRYATRAKEILLAYAAKYPTYPYHDKDGKTGKGGGKLSAQTLDEAMYLIPLTQGADLIWDTLSPEEQRRAADGVLRPAAEVIRQHKMGVHNIQCWKNSAVGLVGFLLNDSALINDAINDPDRGYITQMAKGVQPDGVWYEGAWGYHFFTIGATWPLTEAARNCGINLYGAAFRRMFEAPLNLAMPNLTLPAFNDSGEVSLRGLNVYEVALARYGDAAFAAPLAASKRASMLALVLGRRELPKAPSTTFTSRNFPDSGYAVLRSGANTDATWLALKYGPHGGGHGHPDKLNFVLASGGEVVAYDPGTVLYTAPLHAQWDRATVAHNTLTVDEVSQTPAQGKAVAFISRANESGVLAEAGLIYPGVQFRRAVALFSNDVVLVFDRVIADRNHTFDLAYHSRGKYADALAGTTWQAPNAPGYMHFKDARKQPSASEFSTAIQVAKSVPSRFTALTAAPSEFIAGTGVDSNIRNRAPMILVRSRGRELFLGWAVTLGASSQQPPALRFTGTPARPTGVEAQLGTRSCQINCQGDVLVLSQR